MTIAAITASIFFLSSCSKEDASSYKKAAFAGAASSKAKMTCNGKTQSLNTPFDVEKGDKLVFTDPGNDIVTPPTYLYPTNGGSPIMISPGGTTQGFTYGEIQINGVSVATSGTAADVSLNYTVK